jgi:hypothetical protein
MQVDLSSCRLIEGLARRELMWSRMTRLLKGVVVLGPLLLASGSATQTPGAADSAWGAIDPAELALKDNPSLPNSPAIILYRETVTDDVNQNETNYFRIKVFNDEGKKYAEVRIIYSEGEVEVTDIRARTIHADGKVINFTGQMFDTVVEKSRKVSVQAKSFLLPEADRGSILEYSYTVRWKQKTPEIFRSGSSYPGAQFLASPVAHWVVQGDLFTRRAHFVLRPFRKANVRWAVRGLPEGSKPQSTPDGSVQLDVNDLPGYREEEYMPPEAAVKARVILFYTFAGWPGLDFWAQTSVRLSEGYEAFIGNPKRFDREVAKIVSPNDSAETKMEKIYARVQQIRNLSFELRKTKQEIQHADLHENNNAHDVLNHGYGDGNEINLAFVALARAANLKAKIILVSTRSQDFFDQANLDASQLNSTIVTVWANEKRYFLDPGTRFCPFGLLPWAEAGTVGLEVPFEGKTIALTPAPKSTDAITTRAAALALDGDGNLQGKLQVSWTGQEALELRQDQVIEDTVERRKTLEDRVKGWLPAGSTVELTAVPDWEGSEAPLRADFVIKVPGAAMISRRRLILSPEILESGGGAIFRSPDRTNPVYFRYPFERVDQITFQLPPGAEVENLPPPILQKTSFGSYTISFQSEAGALRCDRRLAIEAIFFNRQAYPALRAFFVEAQKGDQSRIVFKAAENTPKN